MKSPYKLAQELGITSTAVYKKIKQLDNKLEPHIQKASGGKMLLNEEAELILRESFSDVMQPVKEQDDERFDNPLDNMFDKLHNMFDREIEFLKKQNEMLTEQNKSLQDELKIEHEHSRQQADRTTNIAEKLAELNKNQQVLLLSEQNKNAPILHEHIGDEQNKKRSRGLFGFFKRKK